MKSSYCLYCKCCLGKKGDKSGWAVAVIQKTVNEKKSREEICQASDACTERFDPFLVALQKDEISTLEGMALPTTHREQMKLFKTTPAYINDFKVKFPQYRGSLPHMCTHLFPEDVVPDTLHAKNTFW